VNIVITAEHSRELAGFSGGEDILVYSNKGKSPIEYYLLLKRFILKNKADAIVNFGIAGSLDTKIPMGKVVSVRKVFYLDPHSLKYLGPVLDIGSIREKNWISPFLYSKQFRIITKRIRLIILISKVVLKI